MSNEISMNHDLQSLETALQGLPLPKSDVNSGSQRDELMYQAGWAAAMASLEEDGKGIEEVRESKGNRAWSSVALVATAAAVWLGVLLFQGPIENRYVVEHQEVTEGPVESIDGEVEVGQPDSGQPLSRQHYDLVQHISNLPRGEALHARLALSARSYPVAVQVQAKEKAGQGSDENYEAPIRRPQTQREILQEMLDQS